ncbi:hypothetical protein GQF01_26165 [Paenibacillus sp. 5J-6]|uniref:HTH araC/xylS-type domain-containing protein n=1 Tax=Paenibacillus silvestris TaxID=2606219 RepID=A0A6L8V7L3_9BACL|nr:helix-turn-helix transcriptional regulator [Paenibacillus silvestris]MZQ85611.1 hypothetical protein [Paenibacillus silvestris]
MNTTEQWIQEAWNAGINKVMSTSERIRAAFPHGSRVGYLNQMSFIRAFKKMVGTTSGDYRKVHQ